MLFTVTQSGCFRGCSRVSGLVGKRWFPSVSESASCSHATRFESKWVIHPDQIATVNFAFTPSPEAVDRARRILASADGASALDGEMVDAATRRLAESVLARASAL